MAYKIDGSSHDNGIRGEDSAIFFFNDKKNYNFISKSLEKYKLYHTKSESYNFEKLGGTQNRIDIKDQKNNIGFSIKTKKIEKNKYKGTFDLINTSSIKELISPHNIKLLEEIEKWENWIEQLKKMKFIDKEGVEDEIKNFYNSILNSITGEDIELIFKKIFKKENDVIEIIRDYKNNINESIQQNDIHFLDYHWFEKELRENIDLNQKIETNKCSSFLKNKDGSNSFFRIRVVLNNGTSALLRGLNLEPKTKGKNNNSSLTIKIQVDKVREVIEKYDINNKSKN